NGFGEAERIEIDFGQTSTIAATTATTVGTFEVIFEIDNQPAGAKTITARGMATLASAASTFTIISSQPLPDLVVTGVSFYPSATVEMGKGIKIGAIITNQGNTPAKGIMVKYYDGETMIGRDKIIGGGLDPGETKEKEIHWKVGLPIGTHTIQVVVDPENTITEFNENNNKGYVILVVVLPSDRRLAINQSIYQDLRQVCCYPNPTRANSITFDGLPYHTNIKIFNIAGELVYSADDFNGNTFSRTWDCRNNSGDKLVSGIYIYILKDQNGNTERGKLGIIQ
ncbi:MAG: CARDB domain-containing protein, partial [Candidatus Desantisbacteria bacterium]